MESQLHFPQVNLPVRERRTLFRFSKCSVRLTLCDPRSWGTEEAHSKQAALFSHPSWTALVDAAISTLCSVDVEVFLPHRPQENKDPPSLHEGKRWLVYKKDLPPPVFPFSSRPSFTLGPHFLPSKGLYQFLVPHKSFTVLSYVLDSVNCLLSSVVDSSTA